MSTTLPKKREVRFLLAEDLRQEGLGKLSILGFIPGNRFAVGGDPPKQIPGAAFVLPSVAFLFVIEGGEGKFGGHLRMFAPDGKTTVLDSPIQQPIEKVKGSPAVFGTGSRPFAGPAFGTYTIELALEKSKFRFSIVIEHAAAERKPLRKGKR